jgi:tetratricopeptide (TPR) repeat protein
MDLSFSLAALASNQNNAGDREEALVNYRRALAIRQATSEADPANVWARRAVGAAWSKIGMVLWALHRPGESLAAHQSALAIFEALSKGDPKHAGYRDEVALAAANIAAARAALPTAQSPRSLSAVSAPPTRPPPRAPAAPPP